MPDAVESSVNSDLMTVFCDSVKNCRSNTASNWRLASPIFWSSVSALLPASDSKSRWLASIFGWIAEICILSRDEFGLQCAGLFHGLENGHHVARRRAQCVQGRRDFFNRRQFLQRDQARFAFRNRRAGAFSDLRRAAAQRVRLGDILRRSDVDGDVAAGHRAA